MRGKARRNNPQISVAGITPAYAGKSFAEWIDEQGEEDHPRLCGEKSFRQHSKKYRIGSPPPMRGKVFLLG